MEGNIMSENRNTGTFSAADLRRRMAEREAAKAAEEMRRLKAVEQSKSLPQWRSAYTKSHAF